MNLILNITLRTNKGRLVEANLVARIPRSALLLKKRC